MKIALVRIPTIIDATASTAPVCPPLGMAYLKSIVKKFTENIVVIDSVGNNPQTRSFTEDGHTYKLLGETSTEIVEQLSEDLDIILVSIMFSQDWLYAQKNIAQIHEKCPKSLIIAGGEHITAMPEYSMETAPAIDICVLGEGENTLNNLLQEYQNGNRVPEDVPGTCIRSSQGEIKRGVTRKRWKEVDEIPRPDWDDFPLENYFSGGFSFGVNIGGRSMPVMASRGCPYRCTFCSSPLMWTTLWKSREPEDVIDEMKVYLEKYKITNFDFYDLTAIVKKEWIVKFCELLIEENMGVTWQLPSGTRSEAIDAEVAKLLYKSGCRNLSYAPESGSEEILKLIKKKIKPPRMLTSMSGCVKAGLSVKANIMCGFPEERWKHLLQSLKFVMQMAWVGCDDMSINQFSPYPGSELFEQLQKENKVELNQEYFIGLSYYSSMTNAVSYSKHLSNFDILVYKFLGTALFYVVSFLRRPWRVFKIMTNVYKGEEHTRLEKTLISYSQRFRSNKTQTISDH